MARQMSKNALNYSQESASSIDECCKDMSQSDENRDLRKRTSEKDTGNFYNSNWNEMSEIMQMFGTDMHKSMDAKKRRIGKYTSATIKTSEKKLTELAKSQNVSRKKLVDDFRKKTVLSFDQWENDTAKHMEQEEKLKKSILQQIKLVQQIRSQQSQKITQLKEFYDQFFQGIEDLNNKFEDEHNNTMSEINKELTLLQKKILMETQKEEVANVKKSLQKAILFS